jgi:hypothetical protein
MLSGVWGGDSHDYLIAGLIASAAFGLATISPASVFVSPFFFTLLGSAPTNNYRDIPLRNPGLRAWT